MSDSMSKRFSMGGGRASDKSTSDGRKIGEVGMTFPGAPRLSGKSRGPRPCFSPSRTMRQPCNLVRMTPPTITADQLKARQSSHPNLVLLDVRLAEDFAAAHLPAAVNNCVFEVDFGERMTQLVPDRSTPICCYGESEGSHESRVAVEKLQRLGFENLYDLRAGIAGARAAGIPLEIHAPAAATAPTPANGIHPIDLAESRVEWTGRNLLSSHHGRLGLQSGQVIVTNGRLAGGEFV